MYDTDGLVPNWRFTTALIGAVIPGNSITPVTNAADIPLLASSAIIYSRWDRRCNVGCPTSAAFREATVTQKHTRYSIGTRFHHLTIVGDAQDAITASSGTRHKQHLCRCDCGLLVPVRQSYLRTGKRKSCGCKNGEARSKAKRAAGASPPQVGDRFGMLVIVRHLPPERHAKTNKLQYFCECQCDCGRIVKRAIRGIKNQKTCGCSTAKLISIGATKHGHASGGSISREYASWAAAKDRCFSVTSHARDSYGGRGITMCKRWADSFSEFLQDVGPCPSKDHSIDRFPDMNGNYEPGNVRWATRQEQAENRRSSIIRVVDGVSRCAAAHARHYNIPVGKVQWRLRKGWSIEEALELTPRVRS